MKDGSDAFSPKGYIFLMELYLILHGRGATKWYGGIFTKFRFHWKAYGIVIIPKPSSNSKALFKYCYIMVLSHPVKDLQPQLSRGMLLKYISCPKQLIIWYMDWLIR